MKSFTELHSQWTRCSHNDSAVRVMLEEKIPSLLNHSEEEYVKQGMEILLQFEALASILEEGNGSIEVLNKYADNRIAVEKFVIEEVSQSHSEWFGLFESGSFDGLYLRTMENTEWSDLSEFLQHRLLKEVKQMVKIPGKSYSVGKYLVTQALWESVTGYNPSEFKGSRLPVEQVSWLDCVDFCNTLSEIEGLEKAYTVNGSNFFDVQCNFDADGYRLPTEWEWYFAAKANQDFQYAGSDNIDEVAWYWDNCDYQTQGVGQKKANGFGLYDMSGNVAEWCWDWYGDDVPSEGSTGPCTGSERVRLGGYWTSGERYSRLSYRIGSPPSIGFNEQGFRLCRTIP